jgi:hypothetical protein
MRMRRLTALVAVLLSVAPPHLIVDTVRAEAAAPTAGGGTLRPVSDFASIANQRARSVAMFEEAGKVLMSPRCLNCHPVTDRPTQTDRMRPHEPWVVRGADGFGAPGLRCPTCHHGQNVDAAGVPGDPMWHLAPASMGWQGRTLGQICEQLKDPKRNGNMDSAALIHHMADDALVGWAWHPGAARKPAPGTQAEFGTLIRGWFATGAACPPG